MKRMMCVWFPGWPIQRRRAGELLDGPEVRSQKSEVSAVIPHSALRTPHSALRTPHLIYAPARRGQLVVTACSENELGIVPGMLLAEAQALAADSAMQFAPHDPQADRNALRALAEDGLRFSPWVALEQADEPASLLFDITGHTLGFRDEQTLARSVADYYGRRGYEMRIAVADTIGAAWAAAHADLEPIIPPGRHPHVLRSFDVATLRLPEAVVRLLYQFDVRQIGQLLDLPRASLPSRFGPEVGVRLDQALGIVPELLTPIQAIEPVEANWPLDPPIADRRLLETVLEHLLDEILKQLQPRQLGVQRLNCTLRMTAGDPVEVPVGLLQPSASAKHLLELLRLHLERMRCEAEVSEVALRAEIVRPMEFHQERLFSDAGAERWRCFPALIERLSSRLGEKLVLRPRLYADAQPELAFRCVPWVREKLTAEAAAADSPPLLRYRPPCLQRRPVAISVMAIIPEGPPLRFEWQDGAHVVGRYWGPERIETGWWRGQDIRRDYYLVETTTGQRFWLFRRRDDETWFLHG